MGYRLLPPLRVAEGGFLNHGCTVVFGGVEHHLVRGRGRGRGRGRVRGYG